MPTGGSDCIVSAPPLLCPANSLRGRLFALPGMQMPGENESKRAARAVLPGPAPQRGVSSMPAPKPWHRLSCYISVPGKRSAPPEQQRKRVHRARALQSASRTACATRGAQRGDLEIIWGFQERTFSRRFCGIGRIRPQWCEGPGAPCQDTYPSHIAIALGTWTCPFQRLGGPFSQKQKKNLAGSGC